MGVDMCADMCADLCTGMRTDTREGPVAPGAGHDILVVALGSIYLACMIIAHIAIAYVVTALSCHRTAEPGNVRRAILQLKPV